MGNKLCISILVLGQTIKNQSFVVDYWSELDTECWTKKLRCHVPQCPKMAASLHFEFKTAALLTLP